eukprot:scaffold24782_cov17-Tisochrysis_lutea.AAC.2
MPMQGIVQASEKSDLSQEAVETDCAATSECGSSLWKITQQPRLLQGFTRLNFQFQYREEVGPKR